jgi:hypothetical protein
MTTSMDTPPFDLQKRLWMGGKHIGTEERGRVDVVRYDADGLTALHYAAYYGNVEIVWVVLELGGNTRMHGLSNLQYWGIWGGY